MQEQAEALRWCSAGDCLVQMHDASCLRFHVSPPAFLRPVFALCCVEQRRTPICLQIPCKVGVPAPKGFVPRLEGRKGIPGSLAQKQASGRWSDVARFKPSPKHLGQRVSPDQLAPAANEKPLITTQGSPASAWHSLGARALGNTRRTPRAGSSAP